MLNNNKILRNAIGSALVLVAWVQVAQGQTIDFNYTGGFQYWEVPATGAYRITAFGAQGGRSGVGGGGFGAEIGGDFRLTSGQVLSIAVGGAGGSSGGGGGGSFVTLLGNALVIAGGGGGGGDAGAGGHGLAGSNGGQGGRGGSGGSGGSGGDSCSYCGGGGGGFRDNGTRGGIDGGGGGFGFPAGLAGGFSGTGDPNGVGGFGGGGGVGEYVNLEGGGGGGYSGGGGGGHVNEFPGGGGGGGGSFNAGLNPIGVEGFQAGDGLVQIMIVPKLSITNSAPGFATVSWAPASTNWVLQENLNFGITNWVNSPSGTNNPVTIPTDQPAKFYRLLKQ